MKTNLVEIFQTIRATLQPYETFGFTNRTNSDTAYDLWSDKKFATLSIEKDHVGLKLYNDKSTKQIKKLDDVLLNQIEEAAAVEFKLFKEKEWV